MTEADYTRCEHRFYFSDKNEWSSWSESFEKGSVTTTVESEIAEVEVRNVEPLYSADKIHHIVSTTQTGAWTCPENYGEVFRSFERDNDDVEHCPICGKSKRFVENDSGHRRLIHEDVVLEEFQQDKTGQNGDTE